jgi:hypothetical protein
MNKHEEKALEILSQKKLLTRMQWYDLFYENSSVSWHVFKFKIAQKLVVSGKVGIIKDYYYTKESKTS